MSFSSRPHAADLGRNDQQTDDMAFLLLSDLVKTSPYISLGHRNTLLGKCRNNDVSVLQDAKDVGQLIIDFAQAYSDVKMYRSGYQLQSLLKKYPFAGEQQACKDNAIVRFKEAENLCRKTNRRFAAMKSGKFSTHLKSNVPLIREVRKIIQQVLGEFSDVSSELIDNANHGTGVSNNPEVEKDGRKTTAFFKYHNTISCTVDCCDYVGAWISSIPVWKGILAFNVPFSPRTNWTMTDAVKSKLTIVDGNRVTFVPKDITTHRAIAIEPSGNLALQKGVGSYIKRRLTSWGINLKDQDKNRDMARRGSLTDICEYGRLATLDLAMASDTVSSSIVDLLLPMEWVNYLNTIRSKKRHLKRC
jgi:hypothetical protein